MRPSRGSGVSEALTGFTTFLNEVMISALECSRAHARFIACGVFDLTFPLSWLT